MPPSDLANRTARLLRDGVQAARKGQKEHARNLLFQVVEYDERNEKAWLWLSGVVETDEERVVCLENVLAINPDNGPAQKGLYKLQRLGKTADPPTEPESTRQIETGSVENVYRVERPPISAAAAVLYPERQIMEIPWQDTADLQTIPDIQYETKSVYNDVWEKEVDICAFCACEIDYDETHCSSCKRKLTISRFRYPNSSADLIVYFVLLIGTAQLYFIQALVDLIIQEPLIVVVWHIFLFLVLFGLSIAIALRQFWAYTTTVVILILIFLSMIFDVTTGLAAVDLIETQIGLAYFEAMTDNALITFISPVLELLVPFQMLAIFLALLYGIFKAGPDFERVALRRIARVDRGLRDASAFYTAGKRFAEEEMWASAVLHFQRAAANEPNRAYYHLATGKAYAQLGFNERAKDALSSALRLTTDANVKIEIETSIAAIE